MANRLQLGMNVDTYSPDQICSGWEFIEIPMGLHLDPFQSAAAYEPRRQLYMRKDLPPILAASHFLQGYGLSPATVQPYDPEHLEFWIRRGFERMAELKVPCIGVYGGFFAVPDESLRSKARTRTLELLNMIADASKKHKVEVCIEPMAKAETVFPSYVDGLEIMKELGRPEIQIMADLNYFLRIKEPLEDILKAPEACLHVHIQGDGGAQPNVGDREAILINLFNVLKEAGYTRGVSVACPWKPTVGTELDIKRETKVTLDFLNRIRDKVYM